MVTLLFSGWCQPTVLNELARHIHDDYMEMFYALLTPCEGYPQSYVVSHHKGPIMQSFDIWTSCGTNGGIVDDLRQNAASVYDNIAP